jgi:cytochrome P450
MMNLLSADLLRDPYPVYEHLRSASPVFHLPPADAWMIFDHEDVKRALLDVDTYSSAASPVGGKPLDWLIFNDPPRHTKRRALIMRAFTPRSVAALEPRIRDLSRELLDAAFARGDGEMDLCEDFSILMPLMVIAEMLGIPAEDRPLFKRWADAILGLGQTIAGGDAAVRAAQAFGVAKAEMRIYLDDLLSARRRAPRDDLLTRLVEAEVDGERLTEEEILGFFQLLLLAGSETTTNLISNAVLCFIQHPAELMRLRAAPGLLPSAIEEVLRYRSPVQAVFRETRREVAMHGQVIPAGKLVLAMVGAANRDPKQFPDPARFDITRDPNPHIAFGHGIHFCLGAALSRLEARIALGDLLARMKSFALASDAPWEPRKTFHVHGPSRLPIRFERA